jgi:hypothetical protein
MRVPHVLSLAAIVTLAFAATATATSPPSRISSPYAMVVRILDESAGKYEVEIQNMNPTRFVSSFNWKPPAGLKITQITGATGGRCLLLYDGTITCKGMAEPPKSDLGVGASMIVDFTANGHEPIWTGSFWIHYGLVGTVKVEMSTFSDLPLCKKGQQTTKTHPCATV